MIPWSQVPVGHRRRDYSYDRKVVRVRCECGWLSTAATDVEKARQLWAVHIRRLSGREGR